MFQKIRDFVDSLVNLFMRTHQGVLKDIESGETYGEKIDIDLANDDPKLLAMKVRKEYINVFPMPNAATKNADQKGEIGAPQGEADKKRELFRQISEKFGYTMEEVSPGDARRDREDVRVAEKIGLLFGHRPIFIDVSDPDFGGIQYKGIIAINVRTILNVPFVVSHELTHSLQILHPDLYQQLVDVFINGQETKTALYKYFENNRRRLQDYTGKTPRETLSNILQEFTADTVAERMTEKSFWRMLHQKLPAVVKASGS